LLSRAIPERLRDECTMIKRYTNVHIYFSFTCIVHIVVSKELPVMKCCAVVTISVLFIYSAEHTSISNGHCVSFFSYSNCNGKVTGGWSV